MLTGFKTFGALLALALCFNVHGQNPIDNLSLNRAPLRYYSGVQLNSMSTSNSVHYDQLKYYFTNSFTVVPLKCTGCSVDANEFYNYDLFNIVEWESNRLPQSGYEFSYRDKYLVTLKPKNDVESALGRPIIGLLYKELRPLPKYVDTGNSAADYEQYQLEIKRWSLDFPEEYRQLTSERRLIKVHIADYLEMPQERKDYLNEGDNFYLLID